MMLAKNGPAGDSHLVDRIEFLDETGDLESQESEMSLRCDLDELRDFRAIAAERRRSWYRRFFKWLGWALRRRAVIEFLAAMALLKFILS